ncbi:MAG: hypothetical protein MJD61_22700 [Proteobacteria bacterium]|nr:hypothetical protein [Pseudomonadota bacterium]
MRRVLREASGLVVLLAALSTLFYAIVQLRGREYIACFVLVLTGLSLLHAAVELLRPSVGE